MGDFRDTTNQYQGISGLAGGCYIDPVDSCSLLTTELTTLKLGDGEKAGKTNGEALLLNVFFGRKAELLFGAERTAELRHEKK